MTKAAQMAKMAVAALEEKKAEDICIIDISEVSVLADYFLIANGNNKNQVQAMIDSVEEKLGKAGFSPKNVEGYQTANWVLMDYGDVIVHVFDRQNRLFYDLERIWRDGKKITLSDLETAGEYWHKFHLHKSFFAGIKTCQGHTAASGLSLTGFLSAFS